MARPNKTTLSYFPLDIDCWDDPKIIAIEEDYGMKGGYIAIRIMAMIYKSEGYYMEWPLKFEYTVAKRVGNGVTAAFVMDVLKSCLKNNLFSQSIYDKYGVVTSAGVQKRWIMVMEVLRRKVSIKKEIWLVSSEETGIYSEETAVSSSLTGKNVAESTQKEIKEKEIKEKGSMAPEGASQPQPSFSENYDKEQPKAEKEKGARRREIFVPPTMEQVKEYFTEKMYRPNGAGGWMPDTIENEAFKFWHHYNSNGWVQSRGKKITNWHSSVALWITNCKAGTFSAPDPQSAAQRQYPAAAPVAREETRPTLSKAQTDVNYLFERYCESPETMTFMSIDVNDYNLLKINNKISFSTEKATEIKNKALQIIQEKKLPNSEEMILSTMKKLGVIEFFKQQKEAGAPVIYEV